MNTRTNPLDATNAWDRPTIREIRLDAEIGSYQADDGERELPFGAPARTAGVSGRTVMVEATKAAEGG
jgi:hypothetical protein